MFPEATPVGEPAWSWVERCFTWCFLAKRRLLEEKGEGLGEGASLGPSSREDRGPTTCHSRLGTGVGRKERGAEVHPQDQHHHLVWKGSFLSTGI